MPRGSLATGKDFDDFGLTGQTQGFDNAGHGVIVRPSQGPGGIEHSTEYLITRGYGGDWLERETSVSPVKHTVLELSWFQSEAR